MSDYFLYKGGDKDENHRLAKEAERVRIDPKVTAIPKGAFLNCKHLKEVVFDLKTSALTTIGEGAFAETSLTKIDLPNSVTEIGEEAFSYCNNLEEVIFDHDHSKLTTISKAAFSGSTFINIKLPNSVTEIGEYAFSYCNNLEEVIFDHEHSKLTTISKAAFRESAIKNIKLPNSVTEIGEYAFYYCGNLEEVIFDHDHSKLTTISKEAFRGSTIKNIKLPNSVTEIGECAFYFCKNLEEVNFDVMHSQLLTISKEGFRKSDCKIKLPHSVREIWENSFENKEQIVVHEDFMWKCLPLAIRLHEVSLLPPAKDGTEMDQLISGYALQQIKEYELLNVRSKFQIETLQEIKTRYVQSITKKEFFDNFSIPRQHGWVQFVGDYIEAGTSQYDTLLNFIKNEAEWEVVRDLAYAQDRDGRTAFKFARSEIRKIFYEKLLFLGRYDLAETFIHLSATCVVVKAEDAKMVEYYKNQFTTYAGDPSYEMSKDMFENALQDMMVLPLEGDDELLGKYFDMADTDKMKSISESEFVDFCLRQFGRNVVLKFMREEDQYERELAGRKDHKSKYVVDILRHCDCSHMKEVLAKHLEPILSFGNKTEKFQGCDPGEYCFVLVMPHADRDLDTIFKSERPDKMTVRKQLKEIAEGLTDLHSKSIIHGDLKMLNVVRVNGRLMLIDLDASAKVDHEYAGAKFSSGVLPPEMICCLSGGFDDATKVREYYKDLDPDSKQAPKFTTTFPAKAYVVRSFLAKEDKMVDVDPETGDGIKYSQFVPINKDHLPYNLLEAHPSMDVWAFGVLMFRMHTRRPLFQVNTDEDLDGGLHTGDLLKNVCEWNRNFHDIADPQARCLLQKILQRDPAKRPSMEEILYDDYFNPSQRLDEQLILNELLQYEQSQYNLKTIKWLNSVTEIGEEAFAENRNLEEVIVDVEHSQLITIGKGAFKRSTIKKIELPNSVTEIGDKAFAECGKLEEVIFDIQNSKLTTVGQLAFSFSFLKKIELPNSVTEIGEKAFAECGKLEEVIFDIQDSKLTTIGQLAFALSTLKTIKLPNSVTIIGKDAFAECKKLEEIIFDVQNSQLTTIDNGAFQKSTLKTMKLPNSVTEIGEKAFAECKSLEEVTFEVKYSRLTTIGKEAFKKSPCKIKLPHSVREIWENSFEQKEQIVLPEDFTVKSLPLAIRLHEVSLFPQPKEGTVIDQLVSGYAVQQIKESELLNSNSQAQIEILQDIKTGYVQSITKKEFFDNFSIPRQHGWVQFVGNYIEAGTSQYDTLLNFIKNEAELEVVRDLAYAKDRDGRTALKFARSEIRKIFEEELLFLGRYDLAETFIHLSATCVVVEAEDVMMEEYYEGRFKEYVGSTSNKLSKDMFEKALQDMMLLPLEGDDELLGKYFRKADTDKTDLVSQSEFVDFCLGQFGRNVVLKFMREEDQYKRELAGRKDHKSKYVVDILQHRDCSDMKEVLAKHLEPILSFGNKTEKFQGCDPGEYCFVLVMPHADRDLDTIFKSELPDKWTIRKQLEEIAEGLADLHFRNLVHGDLKMLNVVRVNGRLMLIDLDASAKVDHEYAGAKFSSGVLPPEMIYSLSKGYMEATKVREYYKDLDLAEQTKRAPKDTSFFPQETFVVRSFLGEEKMNYPESETGDMAKYSQFVPIDKESLPYDLLEAHPSIDVWAFGVLMFRMLTRRPLFHVNAEEDLDDGDNTGNLFKNLHDWSRNFHDIHDPEAQNLLQKILQRDPTERPTMKEILDHPYFHPDKTKSFRDSEVARAIQETKDLILENQKKIEDGFSKIQESMGHLMKYQTATNTMLKGIIKGDSIMPKYFAILPKKKSEGFEKIVALAKPETYMTNKVRLIFICPVTLQCAIDSNGEPIGYDVELPREWVKKYGPSILFGLKILDLGFTVGRGFGLPMPSFATPEEKLKGVSSFLSVMQEVVVEEMGGKGGDSIANMIISDAVKGIEKGVSDKNTLSKEQKKEILESYQGIGKLIDDEKFQKCGLVKTDGPYDSNSIEFVHPDAVPLYKREGDKCLKKSFDEIDREVAVERAMAVTTTKEDQVAREDDCCCRVS